MVFGSLRDDVRVGGCGCYAFGGEVVGFCGATGKDDVFGLCVDEAGYLFPREINSIFGMPPKGVCAAGGIAKTIFEIGQHRVEYPFIYGCRGVVVEIYGQLSRHIRSEK